MNPGTRMLARTCGVVAIGGVAGALARYGLGVLIPTRPDAFPWTTFAINVLGCLALGALVPLVGTHAVLRPLLGTGVLGGFTTFSTYMVDIQRLVRHGEPELAAAYLAGTAILALSAAYLGGFLMRRLR
ncbi:fluoride efflux transporter FluC [Hamadaea tsunoensis]|uniref:fluoride efflux transporter FluC n=1 Tax=Hamadaea tsunoensis TaxID=53368 RepID=UPI0004181C16|nr:CrcB family protein [Hamadaea tsunoensis]